MRRERTDLGDRCDRTAARWARRIVGVAAAITLAAAGPALAAPPGTSPYVDSTFDVIAHGHDPVVGDVSVFVNATRDSAGWTVQVSASGGIECEWWGVAGNHFTNASGELGVQTDSPDSIGDCDGAFMHVFVVAEFTTRASPPVSFSGTGVHCLATTAEAHGFEATVWVAHSSFAEPIEIATADTHYVASEGYCHSTGTPGAPTP